MYGMGRHARHDVPLHKSNIVSKHLIFPFCTGIENTYGYKHESYVIVRQTRNETDRIEWAERQHANSRLNALGGPPCWCWEGLAGSKVIIAPKENLPGEWNPTGSRK